MVNCNAGNGDLRGLVHILLLQLPTARHHRAADEPNERRTNELQTTDASRYIVDGKTEGRHVITASF